MLIDGFILINATRRMAVMKRTHYRGADCSKDVTNRKMLGLMI